MARARPSKARRTKKKLLSAGREIALNEGASQLTLDLVAQKAGLSKGGVLYHFGSKRQLLEGLVHAFLDDFDEAVEAELEKGAPNWLSAYIRASFPENRAVQLRETNALFTILTLDPDLLSVAQERFRSWLEKAQSVNVDPVTANLVRSTIDGLWYNEMFGLVIPDEQKVELLRRLEEMVTDS
jgi:AcrR family transcriptional regulator